MKELTPRQLEQAMYPDRLFAPETLEVIKAAEKAELKQERIEAGKRLAEFNKLKKLTPPKVAEPPKTEDKPAEDKPDEDVTML